MVMKLSPLTGCSLLLFLVMSNAAADCPVDTDMLTVNFGQVMPSPDLPVGAVLAQQTVTASVDVTDCHGLQMVLSGQADGYMTYSSGLAGIGYRIRHQQMPLTLPVSGTVQIAQMPEFLIELVKTQQEVQRGPVPSISINMNAPHANNRTVISLNIQGAIRITTCSLKENNINVTLPTLDTRAFTGRGTTAGVTDFDIDLVCYDGARVDVTFTPGDPGSLAAEGVLAPAVGGATGVGVQLLSHGQPVELLKALNLEQQPGELALPFQVRYYQMADEVSAGAFRAVAHFSLQYQ